MARDVGVIPSAASTALTAPATAAYDERSLRPAPTSGLRILVDIALKASSCDKRPDDGGGLPRRSTVRCVRPTCSRCRTPDPAACRSRPGQTTRYVGVREIRTVELGQPLVAGRLSALLATSLTTCRRFEPGRILDHLAHLHARVPAEFGISDLAGCYRGPLTALRCPRPSAHLRWRSRDAGARPGRPGRGRGGFPSRAQRAQPSRRRSARNRTPRCSP